MLILLPIGWDDAVDMLVSSLLLLESATCGGENICTDP